MHLCMTFDHTHAGVGCHHFEGGSSYGGIFSILGPCPQLQQEKGITLDGWDVRCDGVWPIIYDGAVIESNCA